MTTVHLYKDIGLNMSMKKTIDFTSKDAQNQWFTSHTHTTVSDVAFNKLQNQLHLPMDYGSALEYTYVVFENLDQSGRKYYYFISDCALIDDSIVAFTLVLDPLQTFMCEFELDECMVTREHVDRWGSGTDPIRITPNGEGVDAYYKVKQTHNLSGTDSDLMLALITFTSPTLKLHFNQYISFSAETITKELDKGVYYGIALVSRQPSAVGIPFKCKYRVKLNIPSILPDHRLIEKETILRFPSLSAITSGDFQSTLPLPDNAIVSFTMVPAVYMNLTYTIDPDTGEKIYEFADLPAIDVDIKRSGSGYEYENINTYGMVVNSESEITVDIDSLTIDPNATYGLVIKSPTQMSHDYISVNIPDSKWYKPTKPTDNADSNEIYEPALYMEPFTSRRIVKENGDTVLEIPDVNVLNTRIVMISLMSSGGFNNCFIHTDRDNIEYGGVVNDTAEGEIGTDVATSLDITNDEWKNYVYTKRDTDRQLVSNQAWQRALDNLFFMSYGGALVGSRSASGRDDPKKNAGASGLTPKFNANMIGAVGLAAGASVATSLLDAHYMWENQMLKEKQIRNEPTTVTSIGDGIQSIVMHMNNYVYITLQVDDINWNRAYENFRKYGYLVNQFEKPNIRSRKYFNYILTNGAIIRGNIPQSVKDIIASVFDNGITIFHGDYTSTLDYDDITKENIERVLI